MEYKTTLNLPKTDFTMKADLPNREPKMLALWEGADLYGRIRKERGGSKKFILHDGPPYANGRIHMGHALNKILKDIVIKYKTMRGFDSPYVPGWDCHGLPVEHQLFKELKMTKYDIDQVVFRKKAHDYAMKYVGIQRDEFKRLGVFGDWGRPYLTILKNYEAEIVRSFGRLVEKGYIYKGRKPVNWCAVCETALAEAEVEYEDKQSPSIFVKFEIEEGSREFFVIWTTTPWTLVSNVAIAVHPEHEYAYVSVKDTAFAGETFVMAKELVTVAMEKASIRNFVITKTASGAKLEGMRARHPFADRISKVVCADYVSLEDGTGCVHIAPGHGEEDYFVGKSKGLPTIMPVDTKGRFDETAGKYAGMKVDEAGKVIVEDLKALSALVYSAQAPHSYPHCWRCKKPIIFRATEQYFMKIDHDDLRKRLLAAIASEVKWVPAAGVARISSMVERRPDWCLSRQRYWGVPIIAFHCDACKEILLDARAIDHVADLVEKEGCDVWFTRKADELLPENVACHKCGKRDFTKETDIIDVWFDSGVSHQAVLKQNNDLDFPCELYLEGSDQHRGWFQSAIITSMAMDGKAPYKSVLTHGFVVDGAGKKMSKSLGNVITPEQVMKKYGADILRLWVASSDYSEDVRQSDEILTRLSDAYRKIRNTYKYLLSNLYDFDPARHSVPYKDMLEMDRWILSRLSRLIGDVGKSYDDYEFHKVYRQIYDFCTYEVSSIYLDISKDRMYTFKSDSPERRSGQTAAYELLSALLRITAPLLVFTSEEAWGYLNTGKEKASIHLESWPDDRASIWQDQGLNEKWDRIIRLRESVLKRLEDARQKGDIGSSLEAAVALAPADKTTADFLNQNKDILRYVFIVSAIEISALTKKEDVEEAVSCAIYISKAKGDKCARCWNYSEAVGSFAEHPTLCDRCVKNI